MPLEALSERVSDLVVGRHEAKGGGSPLFLADLYCTEQQEGT